MAAALWRSSAKHSPPRGARGGGVARQRRGWSVWRKRFAGLTTPSAPSLRSAHPPLLCEEGNETVTHYATKFRYLLAAVTSPDHSLPVASSGEDAYRPQCEAPSAFECRTINDYCPHRAGADAA